jgi:hypothetical protein
VAIRVKYRRMSPLDAKDHVHIERLKGNDESDNGKVVDESRQWWYEKVRDQKITAYVQDAQGNKAYLVDRVSTAGNGYVQTKRDDKLTDNLLELPTY